jgi:hypothetical protein
MDFEVESDVRSASSGASEPGKVKGSDVTRNSRIIEIFYPRLVVAE